MTLEELYKVILDRKEKMPQDSYVASLFNKGGDRIIQKVGEEAVEVVIAAKNKSKKELIPEMADLWFHSLVLLADRNITVAEILDELEKRHPGRSK